MRQKQLFLLHFSLLLVLTSKRKLLKSGFVMIFIVLNRKPWGINAPLQKKKLPCLVNCKGSIRRSWRCWNTKKIKNWLSRWLVLTVSMKPTYLICVSSEHCTFISKPAWDGILNILSSLILGSWEKLCAWSCLVLATIPVNGKDKWYGNNQHLGFINWR